MMWLKKSGIIRKMKSGTKLRLEFAEKVKEAEKGRFIRVDDFAERYL